jgi:serine phosphatase RsbU (regulator of sigma subunit)
LEKTGRIIGAIRDSKYRSVKLDISNENRILLYSDGLIEEWNSSQEEFGEKRLEDIIINSKLPMKILLDEILNEQERFLSGSATEDDIALIGVDII